jgi:5-methylcytosine-specific restriction enzyme A
MGRPNPYRSDGGLWKRVRKVFLANNPFCAICLRAGRHVKAVVVDHIRPHKGNVDLFLDPSNLQGLCQSCHSGAKQRAEKSGGVAYSREIGRDGWPIDPLHSANKRK